MVRKKLESEKSEPPSTTTRGGYLSFTLLPGNSNDIESIQDIFRAGFRYIDKPNRVLGTNGMCCLKVLDSIPFPFLSIHTLCFLTEKVVRGLQL